ncbi:hypothetical protein C8F04DRAFT_1089008 [Mycena alexandri]|uniref:Uncharacterized protein n=1 Tax=Mycena alexandri TaxID=1745969 RepID=A0AAD6X828_9AGAR|nr:hypothetical protein C8F04DRAFT_1129985 [Mycena alexandri]KAJ7038391.1 hypothetical protein C8F04DRAFT_1089008 [Mycena alexandri]
MIAAYTVHFRRHVLLGFQTPFSKSPDIRAFAHGFNGPFNAHSPLTLGESFGASLKTLVLLLASDRIKSPSDVIQRLAWTSTDKPEFAAAELIILFYLLNAYPMLRKAFPPPIPSHEASCSCCTLQEARCCLPAKLTCPSSRSFLDRPWILAKWTQRITPRIGQT